MNKKIEQLLKDSIVVNEKIRSGQVETIARIAKTIIASLKNGGKVILFGNGGSAADAQHIAAELIGRFQKNRSALAAIALTVNTSILTSLANDYGYDIVFSRQIEGLGKAGDVAVGISTSGKAKNVIAGIRQAKKQGLTTIVLTGEGGDGLADEADVALIVPSGTTARTQEAHITVGHIICDLIESELFT